MDRSPTNLLFLAAFGRTGSTLLDRIFGRIDGFVSVGEIRQLWRRGIALGQLCGCGARLPDCGFWKEVLGDAFGPFGEDDALRIGELAGSLDRVRYFPAGLRPDLRSATHLRQRREYTDILARLYRSVRRVSGAEVIVDSSKSVTHGLLLAETAGLRLRTVHLVRDSRAVAYSWMRRRARPEIHWQEAFMPTYGPVRTSLDWMLVNSMIELSRRKLGSDTARLRYEDLAAGPRESLAGLLRSLRLALPRGAVIPGRSFSPGIDHTVSGNPMRFAEGTIEVRPDVEWQTGLDSGKRLLVTALTAPLLSRYGYPLRTTGGN